MSIRRRHHDRVVDVIFDNFDDVISVAVTFVIMKISLSLDSNNLHLPFLDGHTGNIETKTRTYFDLIVGAVCCDISDVPRHFQHVRLLDFSVQL